MTAPARVWLHPPGLEQQPDGEADGSIALDAKWLAGLKPGDELDFTDARGARRHLRVAGEAGPCRWAEAVQSAYVTPDTDLLRLTRTLKPGKNAVTDPEGRVIAPAMIGCTLPQVFTRVRAGDRVWLDDGRIGGVVRSADRSAVMVEITAARPQGDKLRGEKGINLPDTDLGLPALSKKDRDDLRFIARHAHLVGLSFAQRTEDIIELQDFLLKLRRPDLGVILKIETRRGFEMLPDLLLAAMHAPAVGVMIARGDLAVECGYERLAEVQEEILWLCEAAHLPVIWATQVLDGLAQTGSHSRAEITDAAMGERAECVMLNKGPYILEAMRVLDDILRRMEEHQEKKSPRLRRLRWWAHKRGRTPTEHVRLRASPLRPDGNFPVRLGRCSLGGPGPEDCREPQPDPPVCCCRVHQSRVRADAQSMPAPGDLHRHEGHEPERADDQVLHGGKQIERQRHPCVEEAARPCRAEHRPRRGSAEERK